MIFFVYFGHPFYIFDIKIHIYYVIMTSRFDSGSTAVRPGDPSARSLHRFVDRFGSKNIGHNIFRQWACHKQTRKSQTAHLDHLLWAFSWLLKKKFDCRSQQLKLYLCRLLRETLQKALEELISVIDSLCILTNYPDHRCLHKQKESINSEKHWIYILKE